MGALHNFLSQAVRVLILKPFDMLLFGGSGVLSLSREEWREMIQNDIQAGGLRVTTPVAGEIANMPASDDWEEYIPTSIKINYAGYCNVDDALVDPSGNLLGTSLPDYNHHD